MDGPAPVDVDMALESEFEMDTDALYNDDEDTVIDAEPIPVPTSAPAPAEVEMAGVDEPVDGGRLDVDEPTAPEEGRSVSAPPTEDVNLEDAENESKPEDGMDDKDEPATAEEAAADVSEPAEGGEDDRKELVDGSVPAPPPPADASSADLDGTSKHDESKNLTASAPDADADSFVLVEAPSDSEANGNDVKLAPDGPAGESGLERHHDSTEDRASGSQHDETAINRTADTDEGVDAIKPSESYAEHGRDEGADDQDDSFSTFSDASSANFPADFFLPTIITYPANKIVLTPSSYSLFHSVEAEEGHPVLLGSNADLFHAPLTELFDALREEAAFSVEDKALNMDDDGGTLEWVLEHENEGVALVIGEDNRHASEFSLQDLAKLHSHCGLGAPMRLRLRTGGTRFLLRVNKIQEIRREMDEEVGSDVDDDAEHWHEHDMEAHEHVDEEEHINSPAHLEEVERVDESKEAAPQTADKPEHDLLRIKESETTKPEQTETEDYPNGPDDPTAAQTSTIEDPASELATEEAEDVVERDEPTAEIAAPLEEATLVVTGNDDIEIPADAVPSTDDRGDFDADATRDLYGDDADEDDQAAPAVETAEATPEAAPGNGDVGDVAEDEAGDMAAEIEQEAAEATTSTNAVESVPVPPQFVVHDDTAGDAHHIDNDLSTSGSASTSTVVTETAAAESEPVSTRRSTRLKSSAPTGPSAPTPADEAGPSSTLSIPDDTASYAVNGSDDVDIYADSPLPTQPVDALEEEDAIEPIALHAEGEIEGDEAGATEEDAAAAEEDGGGSEHTLAESVVDYGEGDGEDGELAGKENGGGASPKRRFDELAKDEEVVEAVEIRDSKRRKAA